MAKKKIRRGQKKCPNCNNWVKGTRAKACPKCGYEFQARQESSAAESAALETEKPAKPGDTVTLEQIKKVAQMVRSIGGYNRFHELLGVVREVGGLRRFKELMEAMSSAEADDVLF